MIFDCDALLPATERYLSHKFRTLSRRFDPYKLPHAYAEELCILMSTPGLAHVHVRHMLHWDAETLGFARLLLNAKPVDPTLIEKNAMSISLDDGRAMLQSLLDGHPNFAHAPPMHVTRYLQYRRKRGAKSFELAEEFRTTPARIKRWWTADVFDPLSGQARPQHTLRRNKPITTSTRKVGLVL